MLVIASKFRNRSGIVLAEVIEADAAAINSVFFISPRVHSFFDLAPDPGSWE